MGFFPFFLKVRKTVNSFRLTHINKFSEILKLCCNQHYENIYEINVLKKFCQCSKFIIKIKILNIKSAFNRFRLLFLFRFKVFVLNIKKFAKNVRKLNLG